MVGVKVKINEGGNPGSGSAIDPELPEDALLVEIGNNRQLKKVEKEYPLEKRAPTGTKIRGKCGREPMPMMQSKSQANPLVYFLFLALLFTTVGCDKLLATQFPATEFYQGPQLLLAQAIERGDLAPCSALPRKQT